MKAPLPIGLSRTVGLEDPAMLPHNINRLLEVPVYDPEDARRGKLLNILLLSVAVVVLLELLWSILAQVFHLGGNVDFSFYATRASLFLAIIAIYALNRYISGTIASVAFLVLWLIITPVSDITGEASFGHSLFLFTIPIVTSSFLLRPHSSFVFAILSGLEAIILAVTIHETPDLLILSGFLMIALVSWLSARSLQTALGEVVTVNRELDQRVIERTTALSEVLVRERYEASRNQAVLESIADGVVVFDRSGKIIAANPAMNRWLGGAESPLPGLGLRDWLDLASMDPRDRESIQNLLSGPFHLDGECKVRWGQKTLSVNVAPVRISGGELIGQVAVFHDITREAEVDRMKNNFLAMVSHELRTPLTSILGYAGMLKEGNYGGLADDQAKIVDRVIANTHKLLTLVNELLDQAQIETGRLSFHRRPFQPQELIEYTRGVMEGTIVSKNLELVTHYSEDLPGTLYGDPQRLSQVLVNLVNNAVKFTEQGRIQVVLSLADQAHWCMEVSDTGVGIPQDAQQLIFDPFRQGDAEVTKRPGGIGLGLSIAKQLVQLMHGEIIVKSQVGSGSTFTVLLPLEIPETEQAIHE